MNQKFVVPPNTQVNLQDYDPGSTGDHKDKVAAEGLLQAGVAQLAHYQDVLYAQNSHAVLLIFQAMDAAGKDSTIKHVMSGINPQGCQVYSFKAPSTEELDHEYLWRSMKVLPERGRIGIFNRSYYEETLVVRVHPELLAKQNLPGHPAEHNIWQQRFEEINNFEKYLVNNGIVILKFFLHMSKKEQKKRFLERIDKPEKNWKFSIYDIQERAFWDTYMRAYEEVFQHTSTSLAPWHIIPADSKWFTRLSVAQIIVDRLKQLDLKYPTVTEAHRQELLKIKTELEKA